jgi:ubiquinone biosynthesis protein
LKEAIVKKPSFFRILWILSNLVGPLVMGIRVRFSKHLTSRDLAIAIRTKLEDMGGVWIKVGQVLGMRNDTFPLEFCTELSKLQDRAFAIPPEQALPLIYESLGQPIDSVFEYFEKRAFAAASLAQVYKARLRDGGVTVAVKLQRPFAREYFEHDFRWLSRYVRMLDGLGVMPHMMWKEMLTEIQLMMQEELDYRSEATAMHRMRKQLRAHKIYVPKVFFEYSSRPLLVMEFLEGVFMTDYASVKNSDPEKLRAWEQENGIRPKKVARRLLHTLLRQSYEDLTFHGDLHPGNIVLLKNNRIGFVDFGSIGQLDAEFARQFDQYIRSQGEGNFSRAADIYLIMAGRLPVMDTTQVKKDIVRALQSQVSRSGMKGLRFHERSMTYSQAEINRVAAAHRLPVNWNLLKLGRTFGAADVNFGILNPDFDYIKETARYHKGAAQRRRCSKLREIPQVFDRVSDFMSFAVPDLLQRMYQFEGIATTGTKVVAFLFRALWHGVNLGGLFLILAYLYQHHRSIANRLQEAPDWLTGLIHTIPFINPWAGYAAIAILIYLQVRFNAFIRDTQKPPVRLPGDHG